MDIIKNLLSHWLKEIGKVILVILIILLLFMIIGSHNIYNRYWVDQVDYN